MNKKTVQISVQLVSGLVILAAITTQLSVQVTKGASIANFFSYFTNLSNIFAACVMIAGASLLISGKASKLYDVLRGASVVYMAVVGIVFSLLLSGLDVGHLLPWVNTVLHYIMPVVVVLCWFAFAPHHALGWKVIGYWLLFPAAYLVYSLTRGAIVGWYPYPFLNPIQPGGYGTVALYSISILVLFILFGVAVKLAAREPVAHGK